jgi:hypothetical protein
VVAKVVAQQGEVQKIIQEESGMKVGDTLQRASFNFKQLVDGRGGNVWQPKRTCE